MEELRNNQFCYACHNGDLELAQQLLSNNPTIDISHFNEFAFRGACYNNRLKIAQWLLHVKPDINISANYDYAFAISCQHDRLNIAQWLAQEVKPDRYEITEVTTDETGKHIIQYKIYENNDRPMD